MLQAYIVYLFLMSALMITWYLANPEVRLTVQNRTLRFSKVQAMAISVILFGLVLGLRYKVGGDYFGYVNYYLDQNEGIKTSDVPYEWGFYWLIRILREFSLPPSMLFIVICALQMMFIATWLRKNITIAYWYIYFLFTSLLVFESMNIIRQILAHTILLLAMHKLLKKQPLHYVILVFGASLIHSSALLFLPLYHLLNRNWIPRRNHQIAIIFIAYIIAKEKSDILFELLPYLSSGSNYIGYENIQDELFYENKFTGVGFGMLFGIVTDIFLIISSPLLMSIFPGFGFRIYYNLYFIGALITPIVLYANYIPFGRIAIHFTAFKPVVLAFVVYYWDQTNTGKNRAVMRLFAWTIAAAYFFWFLVAIWNKAAWCAPFQFVWE